MKLKDKNLFKTKTKAELATLLPALEQELAAAKVKKIPAAEVKYKIAVVKTICSK